MGRATGRAPHGARAAIAPLVMEGREWKSYAAFPRGAIQLWPTSYSLESTLVFRDAEQSYDPVEPIGPATILLTRRFVILDNQRPQAL